MTYLDDVTRPFLARHFSQRRSPGPLDLILTLHSSGPMQAMTLGQPVRSLCFRSRSFSLMPVLAVRLRLVVQQRRQHVELLQTVAVPEHRSSRRHDFPRLARPASANSAPREVTLHQVATSRTASRSSETEASSSSASPALRLPVAD